ncbi:MAG: hypothetical protein CMJ77_19235 [Planctomycetaceae bacterium]|nr:hypothetical protein [Planctomycetaceae bacterium]
MSQMTKTLVFVGIAVVVAGLAFQTRTRSVGVDPPKEIGKALFETFEDPLAAKTMKIVRFDEGLASLKEIEIKEADGIWTLPSHSGYPADAENKIRDAATPFVDMKVIGVVSDLEGDHVMYGVVAPDPDKSAIGDQGVGTLVTIKDASGDTLVDLVIGKEYQEGQYYVRPKNISRVYIVQIDPTTLPVEFDDWINKDLLNVSAFDIDGMTIKDYSFDVVQTLRRPITQFDQRFELQVSDENGTWVLDQMLEADGDRLVEATLGEGEELNQERLNAMKDALDNLEIVDVERKPTGLREDLKADEGFFSDQAGVDSLVEKGIYPVELDGAVELLSTDGEVLVDTKDGVQYVLRFGRVAGVDAEDAEGGLNRYLLVSARVNEAQFPEPELEPLPTMLSIEAETATPDAVDPATEVDVEVEVTSEPETTESETTEPETTEPETTEPETTEPETTEPEESAETEVDENFGCQAEDLVEEDVEVEEEPAESEDSPEAKLKAEQERVTKENQRKIDERNDKIKAAQDKVQTLNYRFADWYYVISEEVYNKIHLGQADVVKQTDAAQSEAAENGFGVDAFRNLERGGLPGAGNLQLPGVLGPAGEGAPAESP